MAAKGFISPKRSDIFAGLSILATFVSTSYAKIS
jgi:hypothetical protein